MDPLRYDSAPVVLVTASGKMVSATDPLPVNASVTVGAVSVGEIITTAPVTRTITVTETPVAINSKANLRQITITNNDTAIRARVGEVGMTPVNTKGKALEPGAIYQESFDPSTPVTIYARSEGAAIILEVYEA